MFLFNFFHSFIAVLSILCFYGRYLMMTICLIRKYHLQSKTALEYVTWWKFRPYCRHVYDVLRSSETTQACKQGRSAAIRLRCNPTVTTKDLIMLPRYLTEPGLTRVVQTTCGLTYILYNNSTNMSHTELCESKDKWTPLRSLLSRNGCKHLSYLVFFHSNCSEGTCDGCTFHFLWESQHACPLCTKHHYREIVSACIQGIQVVLHRQPNKSITGPSQSLFVLREKNIRLDSRENQF